MLRARELYGLLRAREEGYMPGKFQASRTKGDGLPERNPLGKYRWRKAKTKSNRARVVVLSC